MGNCWGNQSQGERLLDVSGCELDAYMAWVTEQQRAASDAEELAEPPEQSEGGYSELRKILPERRAAEPPAPPRPLPKLEPTQSCPAHITQPARPWRPSMATIPASPLISSRRGFSPSSSPAQSTRIPAPKPLREQWNVRFLAVDSLDSSIPLFTARKSAPMLVGMDAASRKARKEKWRAPLAG